MQPYYTPVVPNTSGIYRITCTITGKFYIGSAVNLRMRRKTHFGELQRNEHGNQHLQNAWNKHGGENFIFEIMELVLIPFLIEREQHWLDKLQPFGDHGFNIAKFAGSTLGRECAQETREKISAANTGKPGSRLGQKKSPEEIEHHRQSLTGYKHTEETKRKVAEASRGRVHSLESREKRRQSLMGHAVSPETGAKISAANTGRKHSPDTCAKMSDTQSKRQRTPEEYASRKKTLILTDPNGTEYTVTGIYDFCKEHGLDGSAINKVIKGKNSHHKGWTARQPDTDVR